MAGHGSIDREETEDGAGSGRSVVFQPEPGCCGGRLDPGQQVIPADIAERIDYHVWPSTSPGAVSPMARMVCEHVDWEQIAATHPELFTRYQRLGSPPLPMVWTARHLLAARGYALCVDMRLELVQGELAMVLGAVGVLGRLDDAAWRDTAGLLTTCGTVLREPRPGRNRWELGVPARPSGSFGKRPLPGRVALSSDQWAVEDWSHTWWSYQDQRRTSGCTCPAHDNGYADFGPIRSITDTSDSRAY